MRYALPAILFSCMLASSFAQMGPSFRQTPPKLPSAIPQKAWTENKAKRPTPLADGIIQDVYIAAGYVVYLSFPPETSIQNVYVGSAAMLSADVSPELNSVALNTNVLSGSTNLTVVIGGKPYSFTIHIVTSGDIKYTLAYTVPSLAQNPDEIKYSFEPPVQPQSIDVAKYVAAIENRDAKYKSKLQDEMLTYNLSKSYTWNGTLIYLDVSFCFPSDNMVILRIARRNISQKASYLKARQIRVRIANSFFPSSCAMQINEVLYPGQLEHIYIFLQGYNLVARNDFDISLPPEAANLKGL